VSCSGQEEYEVSASVTELLPLVDLWFPASALTTTFLLQVACYLNRFCYRHPRFPGERICKSRFHLKTRFVLFFFPLARRCRSLICLVQWIEEVRSICGPTIPILLVGCKADLRPPSDSPDIGNFVSREDAERVASDIGARAYKECSALKIEGVDDVFEAATRASMLMREGVPSSSHHRRKSSGRSGVASKGDTTGGSWKCCVVC
jgi:GTPase SAR1 family protein